MKPNERPTSRKKGAEVIAYMSMLLEGLMTAKGLDQQLASDMALEAMDTMKKEFGGQLIYFPMDSAVNREARNEALFDKFNRNEASVEELAYEYKLTIQAVYRIIASVRAARKKAREAEQAAKSAGEQERWKREN